MENEDLDHPAEALAMASGARAAAAERLVTPWWYHPILGLLVGGYFVAAALGDTTVRLIGAVAFFAGLVALVSAYRRMTGVWISGLQAGRAGRWAYALTGVLVVTTAAGLAVTWSTSLTWPAWAAAAVMAIAVILLGRRFDMALRARLREPA